MTQFSDQERAEKTHNAKERYKRSIDKMTSKDIREAVQKAAEKVRSLRGEIPDVLKTFWADLKTMVQMGRDWMGGRYTDVPYRTVAAVGAALLYFATPVDVIPDFIPLLGFIDDAAVISLCLTWVHEDLEKYRAWRQERQAGEGDVMAHKGEGI